MFIAAVLLIVQLFIAASWGKVISNKHVFPLSDGDHAHLYNEFQLLHSEAISLISSSTDSYQISSVAPLVINSGDIVTVQYYASNPTAGDFIAAYAPASTVYDVSSTTPLKWGYCDEASGYNTSGYGSLVFNLTNVRTDIRFVYFSNGTTFPILQNISTEVVTFANLNQPLRPRVIPSGDPDVYWLLWSSYNSTTPVLKWGVTSEQYDETSAASTTSVNRSEMCGAPANSTGWFDLGMIHRAEITGMVAKGSSSIYYIFGDESSDDFSGEFKLFIPPAAGEQPPPSKNRGTTVAIFDDMGRGSTDNTFTWDPYGQSSLLTSMALGYQVGLGNLDALFLGGDMSYADGYLSIWDFYLEQISPMTASVPFMNIMGNHEMDWPSIPGDIFPVKSSSGGECGVVSFDLYPMPAPATTYKPYWSYDVGLFHLVGMETEQNFSIGSEQYLWLENDLATVNRTKTPWVVFSGHRPMYVNSNDTTGDGNDVEVMAWLIDNIEPLLWQYQVNLATWGHNHVLQRQSAVLNNTVIQKAVPVTDATTTGTVYMQDNPQATVHVVVGTAGAPFTIDFNVDYPPWCELVMYKYGYGVIEAINASAMRWTWYQASDGVVYDDMIITQQFPVQPWVLPTPSPSSGPSSSLNLEDWGITGGVFLFILLVFIVFRRCLWRTMDPQAEVLDENSKIPADFVVRTSSTDSGYTRGDRLKSVLEMSPPLDMMHATMEVGNPMVSGDGVVSECPDL